ncbi:hypothetical protein ACFE04_031389 [Oxalis oulophora]
MAYHFLLLILILSLVVQCHSRDFSEAFNTLSKQNVTTGKQWAVLVAGSSGYSNYRHQADVCHAYQVLKKGGLKDENIIVFMYDDIAFNEENTKPGVIINKPDGPNVYKGVPKDYTGNNCTAQNFYNVLLGNKKALTGGSGKVLSTGPNDHIFIYYADHGAPGLVTMPIEDDVYAKDLINVLKKMAKAGTYKDIVFYMEACEAGSMFEGLLPNDINIYALTASNAVEASWAAYCPNSSIPVPPFGYTTCLGDVFSIAWLEDSEAHDMSKETLNEQYITVKKRTLGIGSGEGSSHVMQYGNVKITEQYVATYIGTNNVTNPTYAGAQVFDDQSISSSHSNYDAILIYLQTKYDRAPEGSKEKAEAQKKLLDEINQRKTIDNNMKRITTNLLGDRKGFEVLKMVRYPGQPLVDDWDCLKELVKTYQEQCGVLSTYGKKYTRSFANMCNVGINVEQIKMASIQACHT